MPNQRLEDDNGVIDITDGGAYALISNVWTLVRPPASNFEDAEGNFTSEGGEVIEIVPAGRGLKLRIMLR